MKKVSKILLAVMLMFGLVFVSGCGKKEDNKKEEKVVVSKALANLFTEEMKKSDDITTVADKIANSDIMEIAVIAAELGEDGYVEGFKTEIKDYKKAYKIGPMIGGQPFVAYIFEVDDTASFAKTLKDNADLRWNICTEADHMETAIVGNYVFFVMSKDSFED